MSKARAHLFIKGRVQGVFFRAFTRSVAQKLGINGWVRNLYDSRVEAVFEGDRGLIEQTITECRKGPPGSYVQDIEVSWEEYSCMFEGFEIR
ncbi:MAG: acylphosphatase [Nitrospirae bacterium GWC2_42_7]|nr:MAG: acylphosphatase [Nitrospirae bacterium GWC2_42_7]